MPRPWGVHTISSIFVNNAQTVDLRTGAHVRAVALPYPGNRLVAAWWVLTGRAYALQWPEPGDLERVLRDE